MSDVALRARQVPSPAALSPAHPSSGGCAMTSLFQRASPYLPPVWPEPGHPQQLH